MPFRNLGGRFDLGWPHLGEVVTQYVMDRVHEGRQVLFLVSYHYSKGDHQRGCAGFAKKWSGLFEQIFLIYKWKTCGVTLPREPLAAVR